MRELFKFLDAYTLRARLCPAIIGVAPALAALALLFSWGSLSLSNTIASIGVLVIGYALSDFARRQGKRIEPLIFQSLGGKPSTVMLRRSDTTFDQNTKDEYRGFYASMLNRTAPTANEEAADQTFADAFYEQAGAWLRENTRDAKKFSLLFNENVAYGFRRNLFGLKWPAVSLNAVIMLVSGCLLWSNAPINYHDDFTSRILIVLAIAAVHACYMLFLVTRQSVIVAANTYARQLILSTETLRTKMAKPTKTKKATGTKPLADAQVRL